MVLTDLGGVCVRDSMSAFGARGPRFQRQLLNGSLGAFESCPGVIKLSRGDNIGHSRVGL